MNIQQNLDTTTQWPIEWANIAIWTQTKCAKLIAPAETDYLSRIDPIIEEEIKKKIWLQMQMWNFVGIQDTLYSFITQRPEYLRRVFDDPHALEEIEKHSEKQRHFYVQAREAIERIIKKEYSHLKVRENPAWFSIKCWWEQVVLEWETKFKTYTTIATKDYAFITKLIPLARLLDQLAEETKDVISIKVPRGFLGFISHNDSLVIHFRKAENQEKISRITSEWCSTYGITEELRALWRTKFAFDPSEGKSFSEVIVLQATKWLEQHHEKYPRDILINEVLRYVVKSSQNGVTLKR